MRQNTILSLHLYQGFLRRFRNPIQVPIIENRVPRIRESDHRVPRIREIGSLQVSNIFLKKKPAYFKLLLEFGLLLANVISFKIRYCSTCTGWTAVLYAPPNQLHSTVNAN